MVYVKISKGRSSRTKQVDVYELSDLIKERYGFTFIEDDFPALSDLHNPLDQIIYIITLVGIFEPFSPSHRQKKDLVAGVGTLGRIMDIYWRDQELDLELYPDLKDQDETAQFLNDPDSYEGRRVGHLTEYEKLGEEFLILGEYNSLRLEEEK